MDKIEALKERIRHFIKCLEDTTQTTEDLEKLDAEITAEYKAIFKHSKSGNGFKNCFFNGF